MGIKAKLFRVKNKDINKLMMAMSEEDAINSFASSTLKNGKVVTKFISDIEVFGGLSASNYLMHPVYVLPFESDVRNDASISEELLDLLPMHP
jgi:hypothetical protein